MPIRAASDIRNIVLGGHASAGKTTLLEQILFLSGATSRVGSIDEGNTVCDFDEQEKHHKHSIDLACCHVDSGEVRLNFIDTPGYRDFFGQFASCLVAADSVVVVVSAEHGVQPITRKVWAVAEDLKLPRIIVVNRMDREHANWERTIEQIREQLSPKSVPLFSPQGSGGEFAAITPLLGASGEAGSQLLDAIVETDEVLMERFLEGEEPSPDRLSAALRAAISSSSLFPILPVSATKGIGLRELLETLSRFAPRADENPADRHLFHMEKSGEVTTQEIPLRVGASEPFSARIFKVISDPYVGKLSLMRVYSGSLHSNGTVVNPHTGKSEKVGKIVVLQGKEQQPVEAANPGDIVALVKIESFKAFDTVTGGELVAMAKPPLPIPMCSYAVQPKTKADEKRFAECFVKIVDEDVALESHRDPRTHELVVSGMSQLHLQITWERLRSRYGVEVETKEPKIPYLETVSGNGDNHYRHKKQSGGSGEFGEVWLRVEPTERGKGIEFENAVFGGAISASFVASAEKGIRGVLEHGILSGCPIVDVKVTVYDGKEHPVDSKDVAFQKAGREAFKLAFLEAKPILLEPIVHLEVSFPAERTGDIQGDLTRRRGRVHGIDTVGGFQVLKAYVPLAEISDYANSLNALTAGQGSYTIEPAHYEQVPANVQQQIVAAHDKHRLPEAG
jgi:elongation factor G